MWRLYRSSVHEENYKENGSVRLRNQKSDSSSGYESMCPTSTRIWAPWNILRSVPSLFLWSNRFEERWKLSFSYGAARGPLQKRGCNRSADGACKYVSISTGIGGVLFLLSDAKDQTNENASGKIKAQSDEFNGELFDSASDGDVALNDKYVIGIM